LIGNDIIDLEAAALESNPLRPGFQEKIFSAGEQVIIKNSVDPVLQIWILWSMKESAYKAHQRRFNLKRKFNPHQLQCGIDFQDQTSVKGEVKIYSEKYYTQCDLSVNYIHCSATQNLEQKTFNEILPQCADLRTSLLLKLSSQYNLPFNSLRIIKNVNFVPFISTETKKLRFPFSLSHHGNLKAFSLPLMNY